MSRWLLFTTVVVSASPLVAQTPRSIPKAAETITPADVARHIRVIADDSMMGRATPSPGLEMTAQYVAGQFKKFGLRPGGDNGTWFQRYPIPRDTAVTVPNTIGILEGTDPVLKREYIVFVAHMDHLGSGRGRGLESLRGGPAQPADDSIYNGADDNASGTAGIIELAEAFSQPGARPRRSLIFLTVSGEERGRWGSKYFVEHPTVPFEQLVTAVNLDMIGRSRGDTVEANGGHFSNIGAVVARLAPTHPELRLVIQHQGKSSGSDQASFAQKRIPILSFHTGRWHQEYHRVTDLPKTINTEAEARILRLVFHVGQEIANADQRPRWDEESYRRHNP